MENNFPSTPTPAPPPAPGNHSVASAQDGKSPSHLDTRAIPDSTPESKHTISKLSSSEPTSKTASSKPSSLTPNQSPLSASPNTPVPQMSKVSSFSKLKMAACSVACDKQADSHPLSPAAASTDASAPATKPSFASVAKRLIMQERLRKAEEAEDDDEDDEEPDEELELEQLEEKANAGDARAQARLGQHYLSLAEEEDAEINHQLAVNWLIKAAKQGRRAAARLLRRCWIHKTGITPENEADVRTLSTESKFELAVRKAAMMMYWKLNPDRKKKVAVSEMIQNVSQVDTVQGGSASRIPAPTSGQTQRVLESMVSNDSNQMMDLDDFVEMTKNYAQGIVPPAPQSGSQATGGSSAPRDSGDKRKTEPGPTGHRRMNRKSWSFDCTGMMLDTGHTGAMKRAMDMKSRLMMLQYPLRATIEMKEHLVDWASRAGVQWLSTIIPTQHVNALIFFFIISNLTVDLFAVVIPLLVFYLSFISMIICTLRVFQSSKTWENFRALTSLLIRFEPGLDMEQAESNFGWNNLEPYLYFILSVFFVIFSFPVADKKWIPCSELSTVAMFFTAVSYNSLSPAAATYARRALFIEVASNVCALTQLLPETMTVLHFMGRTFVTVPLGESVVLKLSLPCFLYVYMFYLFFSMARTRGFRGTYCFLIPYLVCFMWCEFSAVLLQNSSAVGLIRTCVAYFLFLFALPVLAFGLAAMLLVQLFKWFLELELTKMVVTLVVCAIPVMLRLWTRFSMSILDVFRSLTQRGPVKLILLCISMVIFFFSVYVYHSEGQFKMYNSTLTWNQYSDVCGPPSWEAKGIANTQIFCSHLHGHRVTWSGRFKSVRVADIENGARSVINMLPVFMGDWLRCVYGESYPKCEPKNATLVNLTAAEVTSAEHAAPLSKLLQKQEEELCQLKALAMYTCHIKKFDSYRFEVTLGMIRDGTAGPEDPARDIILMASNEFKQVLLNLRPGNVVEFSTKLEGRLGGRAPVFELKAIHCLDCVNSNLIGGRQVKIERNWRRTTMKAIKFAFDFFFSPFLSANI